MLTTSIQVFSQIDATKLDSLILIKGTVLDNHKGEPIENARVEISDSNLYDEIFFSKMDGSFEFYVPRNTNYYLTIRKEDFERYNSSVSTFEQENTTEIILEPIYIEEYIIVGSGTPNNIPLFPWPPPPPSSQMVLPKKAFKNCKTLSNVDTKLKAAINENGYGSKYYAVPSKDGFSFVIATQIEQIDEKGNSFEENRWVTRIADNENSFSSYLKSIFFPQEGRYRFIAFVVTDIPFGSKPFDFDIDDARELYILGFNVLPPEMGEMKFTDDFNVTVLIYEYYSPKSSKDAEIVLPGKIEAKKHLSKSNIWGTLMSQN